MRTKTLVIAAVLSALGTASSLAQVYSVNAVGYVNKTVPASGLAIIANPLNAPANTLGGVLTTNAGVQYGTQLYRFNGTGYDVFTYDDLANQWQDVGGADRSSTAFAPGQGFFCRNNATAAMTITFVGEVPQAPTGQPPLTVTMTPGLNLVASIVPQQGGISQVTQFPTVDGTQVYIYNGTGYDVFIYDELLPGWTTAAGTPSEPQVAPATGFWVRNNGTQNITWSRNFSVNP